MRLTVFLLVANLAAFALETQLGNAFVATFALWPLGHGFAIWQPVTSAFLHANPAHLFTNMLGLWMFGRDVERAIGTPRFAQLYAVSVIAASVAQLVMTSMTGVEVPTLGASGGVFGVLGAFALLYPKRRIILLVPPVPMPAPLFVLGYALIELYAGVAGTQQGVAHYAHLGGLAGSLLLLTHWRRQQR